MFRSRNNKYAISTPAKEQYGGDAIGGRGVAYGLNVVRVDGNDIFAVYNATKAAREYAIKESKPALIEAMTYRLGHHSTSDDASRYRKNEEVKNWRETNNPITRLGFYMQRKGWWSEEQEKNLRTELRAQTLAALARAEKNQRPNINELFTDVYAELPPHIAEQKAELAEHLAKYPHDYPVDLHAK